MTTTALSAHQITRLGEVTTDLAWIGRAWPDLYELRLPGNRRRRPAGPLSPAARQHADELARAERADRATETVLGATAAPVDVTVLDALADVLLDMTELADRLADTAGHEPPDAPSTAYAFGSIGRLCRAASESLPEAVEVDPEALGDAQHTAARLRRRLEHILDEVLDGQRLTAVCPWCRGTTPTAPTGGDRTLVVRLEAGRPVVVCEGGLCDPPPNECSTWVRGRPAWPERAWPWLAKRLESFPQGLNGRSSRSAPRFAKC